VIDKLYISNTYIGFVVLCMKTRGTELLYDKVLIITHALIDNLISS
jgi:hypothetical protein